MDRNFGVETYRWIDGHNLGIICSFYVLCAKTTWKLVVITCIIVNFFLFYNKLPVFWRNSTNVDRRRKLLKMSNCYYSLAFSHLRKGQDFSSTSWPHADFQPTCGFLLEESQLPAQDLAVLLQFLPVTLPSNYLSTIRWQ